MAHTYHKDKAAKGKPTCMVVPALVARRKAARIKKRLQYRALRSWGGAR